MSDVLESRDEGGGPHQGKPRTVTFGRAALVALLTAGLGLFAAALNGIAEVDGRLAGAPQVRSEPASYRQPERSTMERQDDPLSERCPRDAPWERS